jgi:hypothetical protein
MVQIRLLKPSNTMRLSPIDPIGFVLATGLAMAHVSAGR